MTILSVSNKKGYISFVLDEISYIDRSSTLFIPSRDEPLLRTVRQYLEELNIKTYVKEDYRSRPAAVIEDIDGLVKIYTILPDYKYRDKIKQIISKIMGEDTDLIEDCPIDNVEEYDIGWLTAYLDLKGIVCYPPRYRVMLRSHDEKRISRVESILDSLLIDYKKFINKDLITISIGTRHSILKMCSIFEVNLKKQADLNPLINHLNETPRRSIDHKAIANLIKNGIDLEEACAILNIPSNKIRYIKSRIKK
jgi:hypothetical protein